MGVNMDTIKHLKLEFNGIQDTILKFSNEGDILNFLDKLEEALITSDLESICYFTNELVNWYKNNISSIQSNSFEHLDQQHIRNMELLNHFNEEFKNYEMEDATILTDVSTDQVLIFISHKSDDKEYGDALREFITGLGVQNDQLIYTSHPLHKIPLDSNIYEYLRGHINDKVFMIILWSDEYLDSPACLNEMGAAWVVQCDYTNVYVPTFSFDNPKYRECAVDTYRMGAVLNGNGHCKSNMIDLKDKICDLFNLSIKEREFVYLLDSFMQEITRINNDSQEKPIKKEVPSESTDKNKIQELRDQYGDGMVDMMADKLTDEIIKQPATQQMINQRITRNFLSKKKK